MDRKNGTERMIYEVLAIYPGTIPIADYQVSAFKEVIKELDYSEMTVIKHLMTNYDFASVARILDVPAKYIKRKYRRAIRRLRSPIRYKKIFHGLKTYETTKDMVYGTRKIESCMFTTKTTNTLLRNNIRTVEELEAYISNVPERFAYIEGLGKIGMSEVLYFFLKTSE